jgi:hypothetical protein
LSCTQIWLDPPMDGCQCGKTRLKIFQRKLRMYSTSIQFFNSFPTLNPTCLLLRIPGLCICSGNLMHLSNVLANLLSLHLQHHPLLSLLDSYNFISECITHNQYWNTNNKLWSAQVTCLEKQHKDTRNTLANSTLIILFSKMLNSSNIISSKSKHIVMKNL